MLQTPVTSAPSALAICTANVPTPPDAPLIRTFVPRLDLPLVAKALQRGERRHGHGRRLLERHVRRLRHDRSLLANAHVLGEGAVSPAEHLVTRSKLRDVLADRLHRPGEVDAESLVSFGLRSPIVRARDPRPAGHAVPVRWVHRSRANPHQHLVVGGRRLLDLPKLENVGRAEPVSDDRLHWTATVER